jgi:dTDP-4-amino-4,6-dideoxygalactose transaminase
MYIPFNKPSLIGSELENISIALSNGHISGNGFFSKKSEKFLRNFYDNKPEVLLTTSCTHALEITALLLDCQPGDEVIFPSFTFVSTVNAFALRGVKPVFADIDPIYLNITASEIERLITPRTKAVVVIHYGGVAADLGKIIPLLKDKNIHLIEDAAHAFGGTYQGQPLGTFGTFGTLSFHETKNVTCGEGGALIINDLSYLERARIIRDKGTNRHGFERGDAPFYTWVDLGSSYVMSDILAAFLYAQLEHHEKILQRRREIYIKYRDGLKPLYEKGLISYSQNVNVEESAAHLFFILLKDTETRAKLINHLKSKEIYAVFHYQPIHLSPFVENNWGKQQRLPVTEKISQHLLRLPFFYSLTEEDIKHTSWILRNFFN